MVSRSTPNSVRAFAFFYKFIKGAEYQSRVITLYLHVQWVFTADIFGVFYFDRCTTVTGKYPSYSCYSLISYFQSLTALWESFHRKLCTCHSSSTRVSRGKYTAHWHSPSLTRLVLYLLTYLLHGAESFLRS